MAKQRNDSLDRSVTLAKAIGDAHRLRALLALRSGELCACQLIDLLELAPSTVSRHMSVLKQAGLVMARKCGRWTHYRLPGEDAFLPVKDMLSWLERTAGQSQQALTDQRKLSRICRVAPEELCKRRQRKRGQDPGGSAPQAGHSSLTT